MTDEKIEARGWSVPIYRAIEAAGGPVKVAEAFGMKTAQMPAYQWPRKRNIPTEYIAKLCDLGGGAVSVEAIVRDVAAAAEEARAGA